MGEGKGTSSCGVATGKDSIFLQIIIALDSVINHKKQDGRQKTREGRKGRRKIKKVVEKEEGRKADVTRRRWEEEVGH